MSHIGVTHGEHGHIVLSELPHEYISRESSIRFNALTILFIVVPYAVFVLGLFSAPNSSAKPYWLGICFLVLLLASIPAIIWSVRRGKMESPTAVLARLSVYAREHLIPAALSAGFDITEAEAISLLKRNRIAVSTDNPYNASYLELRHRTLDWYLASPE